MRLWPAGERILSPFFVCLLFTVLGVVPVALLTGSPLRIIGAVGLVASVASWDAEWLAPIARLEERYATSAFVTRRLEWRARRRALLRMLLPRIMFVGRCSACAVGAVGVIAVVAGLCGVPVPTKHPSASLRGARALSYALSFTALVAVAGGRFLRREIRWWDEQAQTPLRPIPVVTAAEMFGRLSHPTAKAVVHGLWFDERRGLALSLRDRFVAEALVVPDGARMMKALAGELLPKFRANRGRRRRPRDFLYRGKAGHRALRIRS